MNTYTTTAFDRFERKHGSATFDLLNERIGEVMKEEHPEYDELSPAEKDILWAEYVDRYTGDAVTELIYEYDRPTQFSLKEDNAGGLLLTVTDPEDVLMIFTSDATAMGEYLNAVAHDCSLEYLQNIAWAHEVDEDDHDTYAAEWADDRVIADNAGLYLDRANNAGTEAITVSNMLDDALATLAACDTAEQVRDIVVAHDDLIVPTESRLYTPDQAYRNHDTAWKVCRIVYDKLQPENFEELQQLANLWNDVCAALIGAESISLDAFRTTDADGNELGHFEPCEFADADEILFCCERVNLSGIKPYDLTSTMADFIAGDLLAQYDFSGDGDSETFYFRKK